MQRVEGVNVKELNAKLDCNGRIDFVHCMRMRICANRACSKHPFFGLSLCSLSGLRNYLQRNHALLHHNQISKKCGCPCRGAARESGKESLAARANICLLGGRTREQRRIGRMGESKIGRRTTVARSPHECNGWMSNKTRKSTQFR